MHHGNGIILAKISIKLLEENFKGSIEIPASHRPLLEGTYKPAQPYKLETKLPRPSTNGPKNKPNVSLNNQASTVELSSKKCQQSMVK